MKQSRIRKIIVHCSDTPDHQKIGYFEINSWHQARGWEGWAPKHHENGRIYCGYHYLVDKDGFIEIGRPEHVVGAHCIGHNVGSLGVCWIGRHNLNLLQREALFQLLDALMEAHGLTVDDIYGHKEFNQHKTCPNFHLPTTFLSMNHFRQKLFEYTQPKLKKE